MEEKETLELVKPGCLGTCWYGKYHYVEPYVGCSHDCLYCYGKFRSAVTDKLSAIGADFEHPVPIMEPDKLIAELKKQADSGELSIIKLSRYTDIFSAPFVENGLAYRVLKTLVDSKVKRIIITTKGVPDRKILDLITSNPAKFSYNVVMKPVSAIKLEGDIGALEGRIKAAAEVMKSGALTTIHMDPLIPGYEDEEKALRELFGKLKEHGLKRVMFSYLLLNNSMIEYMKKKAGAEFVNKILEFYDKKEIQILPKQPEAVYISIRPEIKEKSVDRIAGILTEMGFNFVLCGLKSGKGEAKIDRKKCPMCDGKFYA